MELEKSRLANELLQRVLEKDVPQRTAFIRAECDGDVELEQFVIRLAELAESPTAAGLVPPLGHGAADGLWSELVNEAKTRTAASVGSRVGPYRVLRELGRGGMAIVYLAERCDGHFDQTVALKLLPRGAETAEAVDRFERERQILAQLVHPNIAHLLDGGLTVEGVPYFAMEYVDGTPIDAYCDQQQLPLAERIRLFLVVANAVAFANSRLVVHRDIKPTNLLVTSSGDVKLLDFGIARLVTGDDAGVTRTLARAMTPEYASPEQVLGEPITTASDVYQLGLLLYELLTGCRAQGTEFTTPSAFEEAVCRVESPKPSTRWETAGAIDRARKRSATPTVVRRLLDGDLDNIVMKALRKEPERRYRSVGHFADDVQRFLDRRPISARPDAWTYRARKFVSRHRVGVTVGSLLVGLLTAYAVTVTLHSDRLEAERDRTRVEATKAVEVKDFLLQLFTADNPTVSHRPQPTATDVLEDGVQAVRGNTQLDPLVRAELLSAMGESLRKLDRYDEARGAFAEAAHLRREHLPSGHVDRSLEKFEQGLMAWEVDQFETARPLFEAVVEERRRALGDAGDLVTIRASSLLATTLYALGEYDLAISTEREAIAQRESLPGGGLPHLPRMWANLGFMLAGYGNLTEGEAVERKAIAQVEGSDAYPPSLRYGLRSNLARTLSMAGRHEEARQEIESVMAGWSQYHPGAHSHRTQTLLLRAEILAEGGWVNEATVRLEELEVILAGVEGGGERYPARIPRLRATIAAANGADDSAEKILRELIEDRSPPQGRNTRVFARDCLHLGQLLLRRGDPASTQEALDRLRQAEELFERHVLPSHPDRVLTQRLIRDLSRVGIP